MSRPARTLLAVLLLLGGRSGFAPGGGEGEAPPSVGSPRPLVAGHRGARARYPENTLPAFGHALAAGADAIELDVTVTRDDRLAVIHDATLPPDHVSGPDGRPVRLGIRVRSLTLAELRRFDAGSIPSRSFPGQKPVPGTRIPSLDEVLDLLEAPEPPAARAARLFLELKRRDDPDLYPEPLPYGRIVVDLLRRRGFLGRTLVLSFDAPLLAAVGRLEPGLPLCLLSDAPGDLVAPARAAGATWAGPHHARLDSAAVSALHAAGLKALAWTPNAPSEQDRLIGLDIDAIVTDDPEPLVRRLRARRSAGPLVSLRRTGENGPMPLLEYHCSDCGRKTEDLVLAGDSPSAPSCSACGSLNVSRLLSVFAAHASASGPSALPCGDGACPPESCGGGACGMEGGGCGMPGGWDA